ncbi:hypothetical protein [Sphingorhabdus sp. Alg231-15]|uniref:hypothetical protein n=1 Tax=Sphingorhabdus sp. Alg231-15 TaxID=1922222 RepID=UPI000D554DB5
MKLKIATSLILIVILIVWIPKIGCIYPIHYTQTYVIKLRIDDENVSDFKREFAEFASREKSNFEVKQFSSQTVGDSFTVNHMGFCNFKEYVFTINSFDKNRYDIFLFHNFLFSDGNIQSKARAFVEILKPKYEVIEHGHIRSSKVDG